MTAPDARCFTLPDGSCIAPPPCMHTPRTHWTARHARFNPGPPSMTKRQRRNRAHVEAIAENEERERAKRASA